jgi:chlorite dismutase
MEELQKKDAQEKPIEPKKTYICQYCLLPFEGPARAWYMMYCSNSHRQMAYRRRKRDAARKAAALIGQSTTFYQVEGAAS